MESAAPGASYGVLCKIPLIGHVHTGRPWEGHAIEQSCPLSVGSGGLAAMAWVGRVTRCSDAMHAREIISPNRYVFRASCNPDSRGICIVSHGRAASGVLKTLVAVRLSPPPPHRVKKKSFLGCVFVRLSLDLSKMSVES